MDLRLKFCVRDGHDRFYNETEEFYIFVWTITTSEILYVANQLTGIRENVQN